LGPTVERRAARGFRELGEKGARARTYRLSNKGLEEAKVLRQAMAEQ